MPNQAMADLIVIIHFAFILFVVFGGLLVLKWRWLIWFHIPAVIWGALIEFAGWVCPLTVLENRLRFTDGVDYASGFIEHYIIPIIYPSVLTREIQCGLGLAVLGLNCWFYLKLYRKSVKKQAGSY